jgi:hypothetical protein
MDFGTRVTPDQGERQSDIRFRRDRPDLRLCRPEVHGGIVEEH